MKKNLDALLDAIATNSREDVKSRNTDLLLSLQKLGEAIAKNLWPNWLKTLLSQCANYQNNHENGKATWKSHLDAIISNKKLLENQTWTFEEDERPAFDPDEIIQRARDEFAINNLFEKIIATLSSLASCGELDSVKACKDLEEIIRILKKANSGSFFSQVITWDFARRYIPNLFEAYLKGNPVTGPLVEAFEKTAEELDVSLDQAKDRMGEAILQSAASVFKAHALPTSDNAALKKLPSPKA